MDGLVGKPEDYRNYSNEGGGNKIEFVGDRERFTNYIDDVKKSPTLYQDVNPITLHTVDKMNQQLVRDKVSMSKNHCDVAIESINNGDPICDFVVKENPHVLQSEGQGFTYKAGKTFHKGLHAAMQDATPGQIEEMHERNIRNAQ